jgi:hypothetical protein
MTEDMMATARRKSNEPGLPHEIVTTLPGDRVTALCEAAVESTNAKNTKNGLRIGLKNAAPERLDYVVTMSGRWPWEFHLAVMITKDGTVPPTIDGTTKVVTRIFQFRAAQQKLGKMQAISCYTVITHDLANLIRAEDPAATHEF